MCRVTTYLAALLLCLNAMAQEDVNIIDAVQLFADGRHADARKAFELLHQRDSTDDAPVYYMGLCDYSLGRPESAEKYLTAAVRMDSTNTWYLNSLASLYSAYGRHDEAAGICEKLIKLNPGTYRTPYSLTIIGDRKLAMRDEDTALEYYNAALDADPEYAAAELGKAEVMRIKGNLPAFFLSLDKIMDNGTVIPSVKSNYMKLLFENIDSRFYWVWGEQMNALVDKCLKTHPDDIQAHRNKITTCFIKNDTLGVMDQCRQIAALAREKKDTTNLLMALSTLADSYYQKGERKMAYSLYDDILKIEPGYAPVLNNYAYFLCEEHRKLKKALAMSRKAIEAEPDNATYLDTYGWILYLLKRPAEAKPHFKHAMIYGGKDSAVVLEHYSKVLDALGEKDLSAYYHSLSIQKQKK